ncbi:MAG: hypothetical protein IMW89_22595, partial [Ktedonobacteraceae bacterium]|nr:hypothetical protein [Ktedonobacteraceae bacterium]
QHTDHHQPPTYVKLKDVEHDVGITRVTLRKYMAQLGIEPRTWHVGDRSLYITQEEKERIKRLKQNPSLLEQLRREQVSSQSLLPAD